MLANGLGPDDIKHIQINTFHESACLFQGVPDSTSMAQYSLSFAVATQAVHGRIGVEQVSGDGLADCAVHAMIKRISVAESDAHNATFPHTRDADVQITLNDGRVLDSGLVHAPWRQRTADGRVRDHRQVRGLCVARNWRGQGTGDRGGGDRHGRRDLRS